LELRDFIVTPIYFMLIFITAYVVRPYFTDETTKRYWMPALTLKLFGALALGFIYQFYYGGGDTYNFHSRGSRHIWNAFWDDPSAGIRLFLHDTNHQGLYQHIEKIPFYNDTSSFVIVRISFLIDLLTFSTYSATALIFALISFVGTWLFFKTFYQMYPHLHKPLAFAAFFIPSVVFWGSGVMKDTVTWACLGIGTYQVYRIFIKKNFFIGNIVLFLLACIGMYSIKIYILLAFLPAAVIWVFMENYDKIRSKMLKVVFFPVVLGASVTAAYFVLIKAGSDDPRYAIDSIARTAQVTAYDIAYWTGRDAGSTYTLGELDGTWGSMVKLTPQAINVSLFRPYLWEVRNPLMLLSAMESLMLLVMTIVILSRARQHAALLLTQPTILFCLVFSIVFAFSVGISSYNFGTLNRYKIPLLPFYFTGMLLILNFSNNQRKLEAIESTE
jgi:hypothetical protein